MNGIVDSEFLIRVIQEKVSAEELDIFEKWLKESDANKEEFSTLILLWDKSGTSKAPSAPDKEKMWDKIAGTLYNEVQTRPSFASARHQQDRFRNNISYSSRHKIQQTNNSFNNFLLRIAFIFIISVSVFYVFENYSPIKQIPADDVNTYMNEEIKLYTLIANNGEKVTFPLGDGTIVYLNSGSKLIYPSFFDDSLRKVELIGEAYFNVRHSENRPFEVICGSAKVTVTGTEFNIKNRKNHISVVVAEGSVKTSSVFNQKYFTLKKGDMITYTGDKKIDFLSGVDLPRQIAWRYGKLAFDKTPLPEVVEELQRYYNLDVTYLDKAVQLKKLTGIFNTDSFDKILSIINLTLDVQITRMGNRLIVDGIKLE